MKNFVTLVVLIFIGIAGYAAYSLMTFQPDEASPFVFNEPKLPPEIIAEQQADGQALNQQEEQQKNLAVAEAQMAFSYYNSALDGANQQAKATLSLVVNRIQSWDLPSYFLSAPSVDGQAARKFEKLNLNTAGTDCSGIYLGSMAKDALTCAKDRAIDGSTPSTDIVFIGGPDNDTIADAAGNRIVNAGTGDDTITLGRGRSIIVLEPAWGHDTLTVDCRNANVKDTEIPRGFSIPWTYKTANFIVLGDGLDAKDITWNNNVLTSSAGDTLTVNENCFTVVPSAAAAQ